MSGASDERPSVVPWPAVLFAAAIGLGAVLDRVYPLAWPGVDDVAARVIGYGLGIGGVVLVGWGFLTLYRAGTTVMPNRGAAKLITEGAFRFRRNPIYMGEILILLGLAQFTGNIWFAVMAPLFALGVLTLAILPEERHLEARFGEAYLDYKARTRRWF